MMIPLKPLRPIFGPFSGGGGGGGGPGLGPTPGLEETMQGSIEEVI